MSPVPVAPSAPPGPGASSSPSSGHTPETSFMDVLTNHQARTDHPEGQADGDDTPQATPDKQPPAAKPAGKDAPQGDGKPCQHDGKPSDDAATTAQAESAAAAQVAAQAVVVNVAQRPAAAASATGTAVTAAPAAAVTALAAQVASPATPDKAATPVQAVPAQALPAQAAPDAATPAQPAIDPAHTAAVPVPATPADVAAQNAAITVPATPADGAAQTQPVPAPSAQAKPAAADVKPDTVPVAQQPVAPQAPQPQADAAQAAAPVVSAAASSQPGSDAGQDAGAQSQAQPQQAPVVPAGLQPVSVQHTEAPAPPSHAAPLNTADAVERIHEIVHLANANGIAQARVELHPAELGGVTIQLKVTAAGLQAHIAADRPEALPLLQQAGDDLRRALVDRGVEVNHLDFGMQGGNEAGAWREQSRAQQDMAGDFRTHGTGADDDLPLDTVSTPTGATPAGALVDVKA